ncbi:MAG: family NAD(P)-dependent oxidoreductase [Ilumatobacteraceae bacterium]|nr:family NAD(P)-dependent oxidoreductase [Ilumatobacteraceae bacterium]
MAPGPTASGLLPSLVVDDFAGRVAVITGAASGIGFAYARQLGALGMHVVLADIETAALDSAREQLNGGAASILTVRTDVSDAASVQALADATFAEHRTVHVLCNNAGVSVTRSLLDATTADWQWMLGVNVWGVIHGIAGFVPTMIERGDPGHVVNTGSIASWTVNPGYGMYSATKHAVAAISEALQGDLAAVGAPIGVTTVCPSLVRTKLFSADRNRPAALSTAAVTSTAEQDRVDAITEGIQTPDDIAAAMIAGVRADAAWVFPNRERLSFVRERFDRVLGS